MMPSRRRLARLALVAGGALAIGLTWVLDPHGDPWQAALLGWGVMIGEQLVLRPERGPEVPASHAVVLVALRVLPAPVFVATVAPALTAGALVRGNLDGCRAALVAQRLLAAGAAVAALVAVEDAAPGASTPWVLAALAAAALAQLGVDGLAARLRGQTPAPHLRDRAAGLGVATSGVLMALVVAGTPGAPGPGGVTATVLAVPLLAAWYADRLAGSARRNHRQTVDALAMLPELGGHDLPGRTDRVTGLAVAVGEELDLTRAELEDLEAAARLHRLGVVCLDDDVGPQAAPAGVAVPVAEATASILQEAGRLERAGALVDVAARPPSVILRADGADGADGADRADDPRGAAVLRAVSAFCDLSRADSERAAHALRRLGSGSVHDPAVVAALERVLGRGDRAHPPSPS